MLAALIARDGGEANVLPILPDRRDAIRDALLASTADVVLVSGGSSVGREDHAPSLVAELGELLVHGVALRPASPAGVGRLGPDWVFLLPGNPVSCLCAYDLFAGRAVRRLGGRSPDWPYRTAQVVLSGKVSSAVGRVDYVRLRLNDGTAEPLAVSGASMLSTTTRADGFLLVPRDLEGYPEGEHIRCLLIRSAMSVFSQQQFLEVVDRDEAERRFRAVLDPSPLDAEEIALADALGRVLAEEVTAPLDVPSFDRSNVDGFAVQAADTFGA